MVWIWTSYWENGASCWQDFDYYRAASRVAWRDKKNAERAARAHERRTGYKTDVVERDGRRWRGRIR